MNKYAIVETKEFRKNFSKLPTEIKLRFEKQLEKVVINPFSIGKPLGNPRFRELKNTKYRIYYFVEEAIIIVILANVSEKKDQNEIINNLRVVFKEKQQLFKFQRTNEGDEYERKTH